MKTQIGLLIAALGLASPSLADAPRVGITSDIASVTVETPDGPVEISRVQDEGATLGEDWSQIARDCPPFCIQPMQPAEGTHTIGELELLDALQDPDFIVVDSRTPDWYVTGTIPGSINIPYSNAVEMMGQLGCEPDFDGMFDCEEAKKTVLFCNGLWCGQSPTAMRAMINAGFPADRLYYYRGGMQSWRLLGLTVRGGAQGDAEAATEAELARSSAD
ncbi:MAG: rhodanese-like domain-containing protein [Paracoccus sp. (in: a-proteobacteria)]|nr:rhodanese-like domain-containing protein [Paracoccus sp. (in: a-proteobacteria)]